MRIRIVLAVTSLAILVTACSMRGQTDTLEAERDVSSQQSTNDKTASLSRTESVAAAGRADQKTATSGSTVPAIPPPGTKVVHTAHLELEVKDGSFTTRFHEASAVAAEFGGYVASTSLKEDKGKVSSGSATLRIPSDRFEQALGRLKALGKVASENRSGQDVTKRYVDLEARLKHARSQEAFYLRLMDQAKNISDMVSLQQQLSNIQLQIEEIQGELQFLKDQTVYATVTVRLFEPGAAAKPVKGLGRAWQEALAGFKTVSGALVVFVGWTFPFAILTLAGWGIFKVLRSRRAQALPAGE